MVLPYKQAPNTMQSINSETGSQCTGPALTERIPITQAVDGKRETALKSQREELPLTLCISQLLLDYAVVTKVYL